MRVGIYGRALKKEHTAFFIELLNALRQQNIDFCIHERFAQKLRKRVDLNEFTFCLFSETSDLITENIDFIFSLGGDGTLLDTVLLVKDSGIPVLGINTGRLGFLSTVNEHSFQSALDALKNGSFKIDKRSLLHLESNKNLFVPLNYALNEFTIHRRDTSSMITIHTYIDGNFLNSYWADGVIVATPTGSTGYSMSCGGPIISPRSRSFVITPVAAHNLNVRPIVISDEHEITFEVEGRSKNFLCTFDSRNAVFDAKTRLSIRKEDFDLNLVRLPQHDFMQTLRNKLKWGDDKRNGKH